jgi:MmoB/DmpM family
MTSLSTNGSPRAAMTRIELMAGEEADAIAEAVLTKTPDAIVEYVPGMVQISAPGWLAFDCADVTAGFGEPWDTRRLQIIMAAYAGYIVQMDEEGVELRWVKDGISPGAKETVEN